MNEERRAKELDQMAVEGAPAAVGGLWFDTAVSKLKFAGQCCQQVAGCCQRISRLTPLSPAELAKEMEK